MKQRFWNVIIASCMTLLVGAGLLQASLDRGVIQGTVYDPQKAVMPGVKVWVKNVDTGVESQLTTNSVGFFLAPELVPGKYQVRFETSGFNALEINDVLVKAGTTTTADGEMKIGEPTQRIEVTSAPPLLETTSSNFSTGVSTRYMEDLPLQGRDIQTLVQLFPGVVQSSGPSGSVFGTNSQFGGFPDPLHMVGSSISSNGSQAGANAWFLEGSLNATVGAESTTVNPSPDAVQEFNLVQNSLAAEYGRTSGMVVNVVLKSGTNDLHGSVYGLNRNSVFSASNPFARRDANGTPILQPWSNWNNFGGTFGGPVYLPGIYNGKNRTFFFVSEEMSFLHAKQNKILTVPLPNEKKGNFIGDPRFTDTCDPVNNPGQCIYDPATTVGSAGNYTRTPFMTPVIPQNRIDSLAQYYLDSIPDPNFVDPLSTCGIYCNNFIGPVGSSMTTHNVTIKVDHNLNSKNRLFVSWLFNPSYYTNFRYPWNGPTAPTNTGLSGANPYNTRNQLAIIGWTSTLSSNLVNEARFSFGRQYLKAQPNLDSVTQTSEVQQRVKDLNFWLFSPGQEVPTISFYNINENMTWGAVAYQNNSLGQQAYTANDNITKIWGRHTIKGGFNFRRNNLFGTMPAGYNIGFDGALTNNPQTYSGGSGLAQFLLGAVGEGAGSSAIQYSPWQTNDDYAAFGQDDFRLTKNLSVSLGLRWDVYGWIRERHDMLANFDLTEKNPEVNAMGKMYYPGTSGHPDRNLFPANKRSFGPRFGFAWSPFDNGKTVIRGGYGIVYSNSLSASFGQGNGAYNTVGSYAALYTPWTSDYYYLQGWTLSQGAPSFTFPDLKENQKTQNQFVGQATSIYGFSKGKKDPYVQQWNFSIQQELPSNIVVSAAYVGSHGLHLLGDEIRNLNQIPKADLSKYRWGMNDYVYEVDPSLNGLWGDCGQWDLPTNNHVVCSGWYALAPYPQWWSAQATLSPDGYSRYHSGQLRVEKRYSHGLNFIGAYTYSKNIVSAGLGALVANSVGPTVLGNRGIGRIAYVPGAAGGGVADGSTHTGAEDLTNMHRYDAFAPDDVTHVFNMASTYEFPFGKGKKWANTNKWANAIFGGWKLTQNWNFQSGVPMFFTGPCSGAYSTMTCRPNAVGDLSAGRSGKTQQQLQQQWYNPNALCAAWGCDQALTTALSNGDHTFQDSVDSYWQLGNSGLRPPSGRAPGFWNADMSLARNFHFSESKYFNFRWNVFNAFNHQNLGIPNSNWCLPPGPDGETDYVRQFGCSFGQITNVQTDPRGMEFSLKFQW
jgi:hypothetical protein